MTQEHVIKIVRVIDETAVEEDLRDDAIRAYTMYVSSTMVT